MLMRPTSGLFALLRALFKIYGTAGMTLDFTYPPERMVLITKQRQ